MKTQKGNTITIEVLNPMFTDTDKPFLAGDWIKAEKTTEIEPGSRYYITAKEAKNGVFCTSPDAEKLLTTHDIYRVKSISRFL